MAVADTLSPLVAPGLGVVLAHHYHRVDPGQVWMIASTEVPRLVERLS